MNLDDHMISFLVNVLAGMILGGLLLLAIKRSWRPRFCPACHTGSVSYPACRRSTCPGYSGKYGRSQEVIKAHGPAS